MLDASAGLFKLLDGNRDGNLDPDEAMDVLTQVESELDGELLSSDRVAEMLDQHEDGVITPTEAIEADFEDEMFMDPEDIKEEVDSIYTEFDENGERAITKAEVEENEF